MWADTASLEIAVLDRGTMHRCLVRVVDYRPEDPTEWCSPADACNLTGTQLTAHILKEKRFQKTFLKPLFYFRSKDIGLHE